MAISTLTLKNCKKNLQTTKIKECNSNLRYSILLLLFLRIVVICNGYVNHRHTVGTFEINLKVNSDGESAWQARGSEATKKYFVWRLSRAEPSLHVSHTLSSRDRRQSRQTMIWKKWTKLNQAIKNGRNDADKRELESSVVSVET